MYNKAYSLLRIFFPIFILCSLLLLYVSEFWNLPLSEDSGFYAYLSKAVLNGAILHKDIPFSSNSVAVYIVALLFSIFGATVEVYRTFHALCYIALILSVYALVSSYIGRVFAFFSALLAGVYIVVPHIILDLGRNYIFFSLLFIVMGTSIYLSNGKNKEIYCGVLFGFASLIRETFIIIPLAYALLIFTNKILFFLKEKKADFKNELLYLAAFLLILSINAIIITYYSQWSGYLADIQSGRSFRYNEGLFSLNRIKNNLVTLMHGYNQFYAPAIWISSLSYFLVTDNKLVNHVKFFLIPIFMIEAIVINKTTAYSVIPILVFTSILIPFTILEFLKLTKVKLLRLNIIILVFVLGVGYSLYEFPLYVINIKKEFSEYAKLSNKVRTSKDDQPYGLNEHTYRLLSVINRIPHDSISAYAQYPLLFQSVIWYKNVYPFIEDLSAPANTRGPEMWKDQMAYITEKKPDLIVLKSTGSYLSKWTDLGSIYDNYYVTISDFDFPTVAGSTAYRDRIGLGKHVFDKHYRLQEKLSIDCSSTKSFTFKNEDTFHKIIKITTLSEQDIKKHSISTGYSTVKYDDIYMSGLELYSFISEGSTYTISTESCNDGFTIHYFRPVQGQ